MLSCSQKWAYGQSIGRLCDQEKKFIVSMKNICRHIVSNVLRSSVRQPLGSQQKFYCSLDQRRIANKSAAEQSWKEKYTPPIGATKKIIIVLISSDQAAVNLKNTSTFGPRQTPLHSICKGGKIRAWNSCIYNNMYTQKRCSMRDTTDLSFRTSNILVLFTIQS